MSLAASLSAALPAPRYAPTVEDVDDEDAVQRAQQVVAKPAIPPYGSRRNWKPRSNEDFGDGGAYPECHIAQYPLEMGRRKVSPGVLPRGPYLTANPSLLLFVRLSRAVLSHCKWTQMET